MAEIRLEGITRTLRQEGAGGRRRRPHDRRSGVHGPARAERVRQDDADADDRRSGVPGRAAGS